MNRAAFEALVGRISRERRGGEQFRVSLSSERIQLVRFIRARVRQTGTVDDSELQMRRGLEQPLAELLDEYAEQAAHTDDVIAARDWDAEAVGRDEGTGKPFALRYIITHLIAETARHNGHLDILRELADGVTGD